MRKYFFILILIISASIFGQKQNQILTFLHLTKSFYISTTFGDAIDGYMYPANRMYIGRDKGIALFDKPWYIPGFISGRTVGQSSTVKSLEC